MSIPARAKPYRVSYRDDPATGFDVTLIRSWVRGEIEQPAMSASSGPKDYTRNHIWAIFDRFPGASRVAMVCGQYARSVPFLLVFDGTGKVFDMAGKEVVIE